MLPPNWWVPEHSRTIRWVSKYALHRESEDVELSAKLSYSAKLTEWQLQSKRNHLPTMGGAGYPVERVTWRSPKSINHQCIGTIPNVCSARMRFARFKHVLDYDYHIISMIIAWMTCRQWHEKYTLTMLFSRHRFSFLHQQRIPQSPVQPLFLLQR